MPLGHDSRASRRPMPRQLDMSGWNEDPSSAANDNGRAPRVPRDSDDFSYRRMREDTNRFDSFRENDRPPRRSFSREEPQHPNESRSSRGSEFELNRFSSGGGSTLRTDFTSNGSGRFRPQGDRESRQDNQRDVDDIIHESSRWDEPRTSDRVNRDRLQRAHASDSSSYTRASELLSPGSSYRHERSVNYAESILSNSKADSIRAAESPVSIHSAASVKSSRNEGNEFARKVPENRTSSLTSDIENQEEQSLSRTNSETSISSAPPHSDCDSGAQRSRNRYSKPSSVFTDRSSDRRVRPSSPCSSASITSTATRKSSVMKKHSNPSQKHDQSAMSDLRENLYAFRKQMREVFIRVEDMVDVHRSFFKSDPSTGTPVFHEELQQEAEKLANDAFEQLADLRNQFTLLANDFQRSKIPTSDRSVPNRERRSRVPVLEASLQPSHTAPNLSSDDENNSVKSCNHPEDVGSERLSVASENNDEAPNMEHSPSIRHSSQYSDDDIPTVPDSSGSSTSTKFSSQLESQWRKKSDLESIAMSDISARTKARALTIVSDISSLPDRYRKSEPDADSIFKDFDKRMEQIRCSLNAIANGKKPIPHDSNNSTVATPPKNFTVGGAGSPIRSMMDVTRTRTNLREAARISRRLGDGEDDSRRQPGGREAELRQLLQKLNHINTNNEDEED